MRTNIELNDRLVQEAFSLSSDIHTKRELIEKALEEYVASRRVMSLKALRGRVSFRDDYDHRTLRERK